MAGNHHFVGPGTAAILCLVSGPCTMERTEQPRPVWTRTRHGGRRGGTSGSGSRGRHDDHRLAVADAPWDDNIKAPSNQPQQRPPPPEYKPTDHLIACTSATQQYPPDDQLNAATTRHADNAVVIANYDNSGATLHCTPLIYDNQLTALSDA